MAPIALLLSILTALILGTSVCHQSSLRGSILMVISTVIPPVTSPCITSSCCKVGGNWLVSHLTACCSLCPSLSSTVTVAGSFNSTTGVPFGTSKGSGLSTCAMVVVDLGLQPKTMPAHTPTQQTIAIHIFLPLFTFSHLLSCAAASLYRGRIALPAWRRLKREIVPTSCKAAIREEVQHDSHT